MKNLTLDAQMRVTLIARLRVSGGGGIEMNGCLFDILQKIRLSEDDEKRVEITPDGIATWPPAPWGSLTVQLTDLEASYLVQDFKTNKAYMAMDTPVVRAVMEQLK